MILYISFLAAQCLFLVNINKSTGSQFEKKGTTRRLCNLYKFKFAQT